MGFEVSGRREETQRPLSGEILLLKHRQVTDLDVTDLGFRGPGFRSARQVLCGDASRLLLDHFCKHLRSVLGRTELCHDVRIPRPQKPQIIRNDNHHLALLELPHTVVSVPDYVTDVHITELL